MNITNIAKIENNIKRCLLKIKNVENLDFEAFEHKKALNDSIRKIPINRVVYKERSFILPPVIIPDAI